MRFIADLHIHSRFSRATSRNMRPESLWRWAQLKGITVIGTGDFTHPQWIEELQEKLRPAENGLFMLREKFMTEEVPESCRADVYFMPTAEISCIYGKGGSTRKVHSLILAPGFDAAGKINQILSSIGNLKSDGRPILGLDAKALLEIVLESSPDSFYIPAHAWTPHFSVFGAASGFGSLQECYEDLTPHIHAIETGLSSDPPMNWRISALDKITLISNSDAHSPAKIGREANVFDTDISYAAIADGIRGRKGFEGTIEFFPEEGKYHYDGHRACGQNLNPFETMRLGGLCPVCGKKLTIGVMHRVALLADRQEGAKPEGATGFHSVIPLQEILSELLGKGVNTKAVTNAYMELLEGLGNEFSILLEADPGSLERAAGPDLAEAIMKMRNGDVTVTPGYDGEFGKISLA